MTFEEYKIKLDALEAEVLQKMREMEEGTRSKEYSELQFAILELKQCLEHELKDENIPEACENLKAAFDRYQKSGGEVSDEMALLCGNDTVTTLSRFNEITRKGFDSDFNMESLKDEGERRIACATEVTQVKDFSQRSSRGIAAKLMWAGEWMVQHYRVCNAAGADAHADRRKYDQRPFDEFYHIAEYLKTDAEPEKKAEIASLLVHREQQLNSEVMQTLRSLGEEFQKNHPGMKYNSDPNGGVELLFDSKEIQSEFFRSVYGDLVTRKCFRDLLSIKKLNSNMMQEGILSFELSIAAKAQLNPEQGVQVLDTDSIIHQLRGVTGGKEALQRAAEEDQKEILRSSVPEAGDGPKKKCSDLLKEMHSLKDQSGDSWGAIAKGLYKLQKQDFTDPDSEELKDAMRECLKAADDYVKSHKNPWSRKGITRKDIARRVKQMTEQMMQDMGVNESIDFSQLLEEEKPVKKESVFVPLGSESPKKKKPNGSLLDDSSSEIGSVSNLDTSFKKEIEGLFGDDKSQRKKRSK